MLFKLILSLILCVASATLNWRTEPLAWARAAWAKFESGCNSNNLMPALQEMCTPDMTFRNPVGLPQKKSLAAIADLSEWVGLKSVNFQIIDAIYSPESNALAVYMTDAVHIGDCHTTVPLIAIMTFEGDKISDMSTYWDVAMLCGPRPWNRDNNDVLKFLRDFYSRGDAALSQGDKTTFASIIDGFMAKDAVMENPAGTRGQHPSATVDQLKHVGLTGSNNYIVDAVKDSSSPNSIAAYAISTLSFGDCSVTIPVIAVYTFEGDRCILQQNYWDASRLNKCIKKEL